MKNLITAFFMAWGNFSIIPCPYKRWDNEQRNMMLAFLPSLGLLLGVIWTAFTIILCMLRSPGLITASLGLMALHGLSGYMHLDGYMDVSDSALSRRPLEEKRRILKDPNVGVFAVVGVVLLLIIEFSALLTVASSTFINSGFAPFMGITVMSRGMAGLMVLSLKPMETSQYAASDNTDKGKAKLVLIIQLIVITALLLALAYFWEYTEVYGLIRMAASMGATAIGTLLAILYGRKQLEGMNGDIAGYGIAIGEALGLIAMIISL